jgi:transcriptional regulator with XRE-family HTH domain
MLEPEAPPTFGELLRRHRLAAGLTQAALAERAGLSTRAVQHAERGLGLPYRATVRRLVAALRLSDDERAALEVAAAPRPRRRAASGRAAPPPIRLVAPREFDADAPEVTASDLPIQLTTFFGRERELDRARHMLSRGRLVTLTGAGGSGKTRLALELAERLRPELADGVCLVGLAAIHDPELVLPAIARAFGIQDSGQEPLAERLKCALRTGRRLPASSSSRPRRCSRASIVACRC